jgi:hypothetical protein
VCINRMNELQEYTIDFCQGHKRHQQLLLFWQISVHQFSEKMSGWSYQYKRLCPHGVNWIIQKIFFCWDFELKHHTICLNKYIVLPLINRTTTSTKPTRLIMLLTEPPLSTSYWIVASILWPPLA